MVEKRESSGSVFARQPRLLSTDPQSHQPRRLVDASSRVQPPHDTMTTHMYPAFSQGPPYPPRLPLHHGLDGLLNDSASILYALGCIAPLSFASTVMLVRLPILAPHEHCTREAYLSGCYSLRASTRAARDYIGASEQPARQEVW
ncbi:hypothetical protein MRB53_040380 [Persea americana]|nr:hypothetical protein MRB53_040380 [Persea americana]